jgi:hypothetical protein
VKYLVGGFNHLEINISQWEGLSHTLWKIKYSKPPSRIYVGSTFVFGLVPETSLETFPTENTTCKTTNFWVTRSMLVIGDHPSLG